MGTTITFTVTLTKPQPWDSGGSQSEPREKANLTLRWEYWDGKKRCWESLGESGPGLASSGAKITQFDETNAFLADGTVTFNRPEDMDRVEVNGQNHYWIRVRIVGGGYGHEASYQRTDQGYVPEPATFQPPSIAEITLRYEVDSDPGPLETIVTENNFRFSSITPGPEFTPFVRSEESAPPALYLGFSRTEADGRESATGFGNQPVSLYLGMALVETSQDQPTSGHLPVVVWEYGTFENGQADPRRLETEDETQGFLRSGLVTFLGPTDFAPSEQFGIRAFWLRARWLSGAYDARPCLRHILTNTTWAAQRLTTENEILGSSTGEHDQVFHTTRSPILPGQLLDVLEPSTAPEEPEGGGDNWVAWHQVPNFLASGPMDRDYTLDRASGAVGFGDGSRGLVPPRGKDNIRMTHYQTGGGSQGNCPAGKVNQLTRPIAYVDHVTNLEPAIGGVDAETLEALKVRGPRTVRHGERAVTVADLEDLAVEFSTEVARAKAIGAADWQAAGRVTVIIVPRSDSPWPEPDGELLRRVSDYLSARLLPKVDLTVIGPSRLTVTVTAEVVPQSMQAAMSVQDAVRSRLNEFLDPLKGGRDGQGWDFGREPHESDLYSTIERVPGVDHVKSLKIAKQGEEAPDRFLVCSGQHRVNIVSADMTRAMP